MNMRTTVRLAMLGTVAAASGSLALLAVQAWRVRRLTPRLPAAPSPHDGRIDGSTPTLRVALLGESTAAGVGAASHADGLAGRLAREVAARTGRAVRWQVVGRSGSTVAAARRALHRLKGPLDLVVLAFGVNDVLALHGARRYAGDLGALVDDLRAEHGRRLPVVIAGLPPMERFPAVPRPLADLLGWRARVLDRAALELAAASAHLVHVPCRIAVTEPFCRDGFHPGPAGYASWAAGLAAASVPLLAR